MLVYSEYQMNLARLSGRVEIGALFDGLMRAKLHAVPFYSSESEE
jgi:hypothetical protein